MFARKEQLSLHASPMPGNATSGAKESQKGRCQCDGMGWIEKLVVNQNENQSRNSQKISKPLPRFVEKLPRFVENCHEL